MNFYYHYPFLSILARFVCYVFFILSFFFLSALTILCHFHALHLNPLYQLTRLNYLLYRGEKCEDLKALGDLITSFTHSYVEKSQVLQCYDFITGESIIVDIPIGITPSDHAKNMYLKAKRLKRSLRVLDNLIIKASLHMDYLSEIETAISGLAAYIR